MTSELIDEEKIKIQKITQELKINLAKYKKLLMLASTDAPLGVLCLPKPIENLLIRNGCNRVYDIFDMDLTKIKGLGSSRLRDLAARLDEFLSVGF